MATHATKVYSRITFIHSLKNDIYHLVHSVENSEAASTTRNHTIHHMGVLESCA